MPGTGRSVVNMTLSKRGDYVLRSAISLARAFEEGVPRKIREVVERETQADGAEGKKIDPDQRKKNNDNRKKKRSGDRNNEPAGKSLDSGFFLDIEA